LNDFTPLAMTAQEIADACNSLGLIVDGVEHVGVGLGGVVVGRVLAVRPHPNADKVRLADVDLGNGEATQIACGATNLEAGQTVAVATVGTTLPGDFTIGRRKLRGEWSEGMICSSEELGLGPGVAHGILVLPDDLTIGAPFAEAMGIEPDVVFDLDIETNRPDAMCVAGVARDLAGKLGLPFSIPEPKVVETGPKVDELASVVVEDDVLCPRFTARAITGVRVGPSPEHVRRRLTLAGMRPINNVVDASNYVMLELGQPSHPFDLGRVPGATLRVRSARDGERVETLDGTERVLVPGDGVICGADDRPLCIAGIMGGATSEIDATTTQVLLEAAVWDAYAINFTSRRLALRTDASARYERRVDREGLRRAQDRFCEVLSETCPDLVIASGMVDVRSAPEWPSDAERVRVRTSRVNVVLGTALTRDEVAAYLDRIGFGSSPADEDALDVVIPSFRPDSDREIDVIEEVARMHGYDRIERRVPTAPMAAQLTPHQASRRFLRTVLVGRGWTEAWTGALIDPDDVGRAGLPVEPIALANPVAREESVLRPSLLPGLLRAVGFNAAHQNHSVRLFEVGHVFNPPRPGQPLVDETERLAVVVGAEDDDARSAAALWRDMSQTLAVAGLELVAAPVAGLHPTRAAELRLGDAVIGAVGEVDADVASEFGIDRRIGWIEVDLGPFLAARVDVPQAQPVSRFPAAEFDLAFVVPDPVPAAAVRDALASAVGPVLESIELFDVYRDAERMGPGQRSLAFRLRIASPDQTLTDAAAGEVRARAIEAVTTQLGGALRG